MSTNGSDPFKTLGVGRGVADEELRASYRRLVQLHHPDHNGGSAEAARRFEDVQEAYARIRALRGSAERGPEPPPVQQPAPPSSDPTADSRLADLEREIREAQLAKDRARRAAREAAATEMPPRATDQELGYVTTDDSFSKILADARSGIAETLSEAREPPVAGRLADLIDELASKLTGDPSRHRRPRSRE